mmetsp:Transcript_15676/g.34837  ORF Transcript_15676/g.34837 Transcript_15676/m.34837 type:complete len:209 (+) Transcript_15676:1250-1876(+)
MQPLHFSHQLLIIDSLDLSPLLLQSVVGLLHELVIQLIVDFWVQWVPDVRNLSFQKMMHAHLPVLVLRPTSHHVILHLLGRVHERVLLFILILTLHVLPVLLPRPPLHHPGLPALLLGLGLLLRSQRRFELRLIIHLLHIAPLQPGSLDRRLLVLWVPGGTNHLPDGLRGGSRRNGWMLRLLPSLNHLQLPRPGDPLVRMDEPPRQGE